ncbi:MAG: cyclic nucleotide-binding domain-containing protein [Sandaracinaceae bacterium]|nr:cyclic nucleotide-binding domain-containing protein [Sandaracinaceae bacterium]
MSQASLVDAANSYAALFSGDEEGALRSALSALAAEPLDLGSFALVARVLGERGRRDAAARAHQRVVVQLINRGDLPAATAAALDAQGAGEPGAAQSFERIAAAFGHGSARLADVSPAPPPLPTRKTIAPELLSASGDALLDRAEEALLDAAAAPDPVPAEKVPELPLFSALAPAALRELLEAFELRDVPRGEEVIAQNEEGTEAYVVVRGLLEVSRQEDGESVALAHLGPGAIFGEMALVSDAPRAAAVRAIEPCQLLCVRRETLESLAAHTPAIGEQLGEFCRARMLANLVRSSAILGAVGAEERGQIIDLFGTRSFARGDTLLVEGEDATGLFLIASGAVSVTGRDSDGDDIVLAELGPGDVVGEISLVLRRPATATVVATHPTIALELTRDRFQAAIRQHPALLTELYDVAVKREEETRSVVAQEALDVSDVVLI